MAETKPADPPQKHKKKKKKTLFGTLKGLFTSPSLDSFFKSTVSLETISSGGPPTSVADHGVPSSPPPSCIAFDPVRKLCALTSPSSVRVFGSRGSEIGIPLDRSIGTPSSLFFFGTDGDLCVVTESSLALFRSVGAAGRPSGQYAVARVDSGVASHDFLFGQEFALVGDRVGDLLAVDLVLGRISPHRVHFSQVAEREADRGPALSVLKINPICPAVVLMYFGAPLKLLTAWDLAADKPMHRYMLRDLHPVCSASWHRKGNRFATAHENGSVCLWKFKEDKKPISTFPIIQVPSPGATICPPIKIVLTKKIKEDVFVVLGGNAITATVSGASLHVITGPKENPSKLRRTDPLCPAASDFVLLFSEPYPAKRTDPYSMLSLGQDGKLHVNAMKEFPYQRIELNTVPFIFSRSSVTLIRSYEGTPLAFLPESVRPNEAVDFLVTGHDNGFVNIWDVTGGGMRHLFVCGSPRPAPVLLAEFDPQRGLLMFACDGQGAFLAEWSGQQRTRKVSVYSPPPPTDGRAPITQETHELLQPPGFQHIVNFRTPSVSALAMSASGAFAAGAGAYGVFAADLVRGTCVFQRFLPGKSVTALAFIERVGSPTVLLTGLSDGALMAVDLIPSATLLRRVNSSGSSSVVSIFVLRGKDAKPATQPIPESEECLCVVSCHQSEVIANEVTWTPSILLVELRKASHLISPRMCAFSLLARDGGGAVLAVDQLGQASVVTLMQCVEVARFDLSSVAFGQSRGPALVTVGPSGTIYTAPDFSTIHVSSLTSSQPQALESPEGLKAVAPEHVTLHQWWTSLGMPADRDLKSIFFFPLPGEGADKEVKETKESKESSESGQLFDGKRKGTPKAGTPAPAASSPASKATADVKSAGDAVREAQQALAERGEKLEMMAEKTGNLANRAKDFSQLCHELAKKS